MQSSNSSRLFRFVCKLSAVGCFFIFLLLLGVVAQPAWARNSGLKSEVRYKAPYYSEAYMNVYRHAVRYYNPALSETQTEKIVIAILHYAYEYNLDPRLVTAVIACESSFNPRAVSPVGAIGLGQLMPDTARSVKTNDPYNIDLNIRGACYLLSSGLLRYGEDGSYRKKGSSRSLELTLAAYNAGDGAVKRYGGIPPYNETINYVKKVVREYKKLCGLQ